MRSLFAGSLLLAGGVAAGELDFVVVAGHFEVAFAGVGAGKLHGSFPVAGGEFAFAG